VALAAVVILVAGLGVVVGPFLIMKRLLERAEIGGMTLVRDGFVSKEGSLRCANDQGIHWWGAKRAGRIPERRSSPGAPRGG
jgi:hypothetical protein